MPTDSTSATYPTLFEDIANNLSTNVVVYLIGGENLRIKGIKSKTKDYDLVVTNNSSFEVIIKALKNLGYTSSENKKSEGRLKVEPSVFLKHLTRPPVDIFTTTVMRKLYLSDTMMQRARFEEFDGKHKLRIGILQNEDVFLLKCVIAKHDMQDMIALVNTQNFNWDIVWEEIEKQDKDTGKIVFVTILENMDCLVQQGSTPIPFHKKLLIKAIDEMICKTIRNKWMFKDEIVSDMIGNDVTEKMMETRINHLVRIRLIKEGRTKDDKTFLRTTKANVLRYISLDTFYDPDHFIDYGNLIRKIEILSSRLGLSERYSRIAKGIADIIDRDFVFISNRIANLVPAIVYTVIRTYKLPMTRKAISIHANVSEPSITGLYHKITTSLKKHFNK